MLMGRFDDASYSDAADVGEIEDEGCEDEICVDCTGYEWLLIPRIMLLFMYVYPSPIPSYFFPRV